MGMQLWMLKSWPGGTIYLNPSVWNYSAWLRLAVLQVNRGGGELLHEECCCVHTFGMNLAKF